MQRLRHAFSLAACLLLLGCGNCSSKDSSSTEGRDQAAGMPATTGNQGNRSYWPIQTVDRALNPPEEFGPAPTEFLAAAGRKDSLNQYSSTVMVTTRNPFYGAECSGILLSPRIVLTAANCVCGSQQHALTLDSGTAFLDNSTCAKRAYVMTASHERGHNEFFTETKTHSYEGTVHPHPEFKIVLDKNSVPVSSHADLALIELDTLVEQQFMIAQFHEAEVAANDTLIMVGFGYGQEFGQILGERYIRENKVTQVLESGRVLYEQQGAFVYNGFNGGPCFREDSHGRRLVGIASIGSSHALVFTSISFYREWLRSELSQLGKKSPPR
jgi:hypothetical protein